MTEQNSQIVPSTPIVIPPKPRPTYEIERDANLAISWLERFSSSSRLDPELRMAMNDISKNDESYYCSYA